MPWGGYIDRVEALRVGDASVDAGANNLDVAGTGRVRGNTTLDGTLSVTGTTTLTGAVTLTAGLSVGTTLGVTGLATLSTLLVTRAAYFSHPVYFSTGAGQPVFSGGVTLAGNPSAIAGSARFNSSVWFSHPVYFSTGAGQPVFSGGFGIAGNPTATAGQMAPTNDFDSRAPSSGRAYLLLPGTQRLSSPGWWKVFSGDTAYWLPAFTALYSA